MEAANSSENENLCVVCFKNVEIYSIGLCDHPVCFECSTRMRVLCRQNECPMCRQDMPKVIFTKKIEPFSMLFPRFERSNLQDRKFGLFFCTSEIQKAYYKLLEHRCQICEETDRKWPFKTFQQLKDHMRREHELFFCDICVENLKIFSFERRCYTRQELGHHRRKGDPDNTSHRGHPLCEFCDTRYMDSDELFRHLRRNHLFCHFCDADGKHQYYNNMDDLRRHFRDEHYLCEEGECKTSPMTAVFRTDIDLKGLMKIPPKVRTIWSPEDQAEAMMGIRGCASSARSSPAVTITTNSSSARSSRAPEVTITRTVRGQQGLANTADNFPALGGPSTSSAGSSTVRLSVNNSQDSKAPKVSIQVNHRPNGSITTHITTNASSSTQQRPTEAFPALGNSTSVIQPKWVPAKSKKQQEPKVSKVAPAPQLATSNLDQFPSLAKNKISVTVPVSNSWVNLNNINSSSSKSRANAGSGDNTNRKNEVRPSSSNQKQPTIDKRLQDLKITENPDSKNKNKKKKNKSSAEGEASKQPKPVKSNDTSKNNDAKSNKEPTKTNETIVNDNESNLKNGLVKKRSELKIGTLTNTGEMSSVSNDFPTLGETKPPPGFNVKPPPGFTPGSFPSLNVANDLTFTSSSGQSYAITPSNDYYSPNNFQSRNQNLIKRFMAVLNNNDAIKEFKNYSDLFRNGVLPATKYYDHCKEVLGDSFKRCFRNCWSYCQMLTDSRTCTGKSAASQQHVEKIVPEQTF
ncbi:hypothetical protein NQ318_019158 [Aromia moschata]|uniref:RING-type E3 ubiquitin transferase n=1 Tax=Aromia moschata TaxID=1265417 RepID=A0AAV8YTE8_9CUCU|nr:hypothetical protein NQ318_019158 [Aromia moschata]